MNYYLIAFGLFIAGGCGYVWGHFDAWTYWENYVTRITGNKDHIDYYDDED